MFSSSLRISRWSTVDLPLLPPACASVILMLFFALSLMILSYNFPKLLDSVNPLSLEHLPFIPFPLYIVMISPSCHSCGIVSVFVSLLMVAWYMVLVSWSASMKASFGMLSGLCLFSFWVSLLQCSVLLCLFVLFLADVASVFLFLWLCSLFLLSILDILLFLLLLGIAAHSIVRCIPLLPLGLLALFLLLWSCRMGLVLVGFLVVFSWSRNFGSI